MSPRFAMLFNECGMFILLVLKFLRIHNSIFKESGTVINSTKELPIPKVRRCPHRRGDI